MVSGHSIMSDCFFFCFFLLHDSIMKRGSVVIILGKTVDVSVIISVALVSSMNMHGFKKHNIII